MSYITDTLIIHYVEGTDRGAITVRNLQTKDVMSDFDLASRQRFERYAFTEEEYKEGNCNDIPLSDVIENATTYAKELAKRHNLRYVPFNKEDGILD